MDSKSFSGLSKKLDAFERDLSGKGTKDRTKELGSKFEPYVEQAVKGDIGDNSLSGWSRPSKNHPNWAPVEIVGRADKATSVDQGVFLMPAAKNTNYVRGLGPMRVLQQGRKAYAAGDKRSSGWRVRKKDGALVQKFRKVKGNVGATRGKGTWDDVLAMVDQHAPEHIHDVIVSDALKHYF